MKNMIVATSLGLLLSGVVQAQTEQGNTGFYLGAGLAHLNPGDDDADAPDNFVLHFGYHFNSNWAAEFQYSDSYKDAESSVNFEDFSSHAESSINTKTFFAVYRSSEPLYFKAKAGFMDAEADYDVTYTSFGESASISGSDSENGWAAGVGLGYRFGNLSIELDHTLTDSDLDIDFTVVSFNYAF